LGQNSLKEIKKQRDMLSLSVKVFEPQYLCDSSFFNRKINGFMVNYKGLLGLPADSRFTLYLPSTLPNLSGTPGVVLIILLAGGE